MASMGVYVSDASRKIFKSALTRWYIARLEELPPQLVTCLGRKVVWFAMMRLFVEERELHEL